MVRLNQTTTYWEKPRCHPALPARRRKGRFLVRCHRSLSLLQSQQTLTFGQDTRRGSRYCICSWIVQRFLSGVYSPSLRELQQGGDLVAGDQWRFLENLVISKEIKRPTRRQKLHSRRAHMVRFHSSRFDTNLDPAWRWFSEEISQISGILSASVGSSEFEGIFCLWKVQGETV